MAKFNVKHNCTVYRPLNGWNGDYVRTFGKQNEGFEIEAGDITEAKTLLKRKHHLNPFYLTITEITMTEMSSPYQSAKSCIL